MKLLHRLRNRTTAFVHDLLMIPVAWLGAYWLRFNLESVPAEYLSMAYLLVVPLMLMQGAILWYFGLYRGVWRFASVPDLVKILKAVGMGAGIFAVSLFFVTRLQDVPRSVFPLYAVLLVLLLGGPRLAYRWLKDRHIYARTGRHVLVAGAGGAGEALVRDLLRDPDSGYQPLAFVDDDPAKRGRDIHGVRVRGTCEDIPELVRDLGVETVLIAIPSASSRAMQRIVSICERSGIAFRTLPSMQELLSGRASARELREVSIEDLLGREPVSLDWQAISAGVAGRTVLLTGGGGSIGSELCRQVARLGPTALVIVENSEFNLFRIEMELRRTHPDLALHARLGDVCDARAVDHLVAQYRPEVIFHAAAYKHVPMLQGQAREAARNNVLGTRNVAAAAVANGCRTFVLISTDKAVNPTNVMGASKRVAEILCQNVDRGAPTRFITVRFGNVLDSAGSVVPLFREQIAAGGPLTVTHREVRRYFMTIPEACQLIMQAAVLGRGGEIYVLDMGEPVNIGYLAEQMILLSGRRPGEDIEIVYTGLRPGEKLFEELFHEEEQLSATDHEKILLARFREVERTVLDGTLRRLEDACERYDEQAVCEHIASLVPEFREGEAEQSPDEKIIQLDKVKR